jgi:hypothetical protein
MDMPQSAVGRWGRFSVLVALAVAGGGAEAHQYPV